MIIVVYLDHEIFVTAGFFFFSPKSVFGREMLTPLQLETRFWGQNYLDLV